MKRRLFNVLAGVSLVLCVAIGALWVRSEFDYDAVGSNSGYPERHEVVAWAAAASNGRIFLLHSTFFGSSSGMLSGRRSYYNSTAKGSFRGNPRGSFPYDNVHWGWYSHQKQIDARGNGVSDYHAIFPLWESAALTVVLPLVWLRSWKSGRHNALRGLCQKCGYDLRATPERCPECGTVPANTTEAKA